MRGYNKVVVMGNLVRDPDRSSANAPVKFTLAVNKKYRGRNGDTVEHVDFIPCNAWGKLGDEVVLRYCHKGSPLFVEGEISTRDFDDPKTGQHRWTWEVNVSNVVLLGSLGASGVVKNDGIKSDAENAENEAKRVYGMIQGMKGSDDGSFAPESLQQGELYPPEDLGFNQHEADIPF